MNQVVVLQASGDLTADVVAELRDVLSTAGAAHVERLGVKAVDVVVNSQPDAVIPAEGVGGYTESAWFVRLAIDPASAAFRDTWRARLPVVLGHELHHAGRMQAGVFGPGLLGSLVAEGLGQLYEQEVSGVRPAYATPHPDLDGLWARAAPELTGPYDHSAWFFGRGGRFDRWAGYALGYELARRKSAATGLSAAALLDTPDEAFPAAW